MMLARFLLCDFELTLILKEFKQIQSIIIDLEAKGDAKFLILFLNNIEIRWELSNLSFEVIVFLKIALADLRKFYIEHHVYFWHNVLIFTKTKKIQVNFWDFIYPSQDYIFNKKNIAKIKYKYNRNV